MVDVEVIYISDEQVMTHLHCTLPEGATVEDALNESGIFILCPDIQKLPIGIFSKRVERTTPLKTGDRIEIYRPLVSDPKEKRRLRAKRN
ncbi:RnfH family protein [Legionella gresilensis]|uniref:RnfH family protein n=1 Tax=Legionella gresilensis TaxID=91823 RepID=UPI0010412693|nr:RnfH family protein [Legionella gresilensis]